MSLNINFDTYYKIPQCVITIHDSSAYYKLRHRVITIYDSPVITILDNGYYNLRQVLQFTTQQSLMRFKAQEKKYQLIIFTRVSSQL